MLWMYPGRNGKKPMQKLTRVRLIVIKSAGVLEITRDHDLGLNSHAQSMEIPVG